MSLPSSAITGENELKAPHLEIGNDEVRQSVAEVMSTPETKALARTCTAASAFVLSYLARTPLGHAEDPKTIGEKALELGKKIPGVGGAIEKVETGKMVWNFISGWFEKCFLTYPPATALLAWASAMAIVGMTLNIKDKNPKWKTWGISIVATRLAIGAIEQWGDKQLNWAAGITTVGAAAVMTGMAIHKKDWLVNFKKALGSGMGAAWEFLNRDIMPASANRRQGRSPERAGRPEVEAVAPGQEQPAAAVVDVFCTSCGSNQGGPSDFCTHCGVARAVAPAAGHAQAVATGPNVVTTAAPAANPTHAATQGTKPFDPGDLID